MFENTKIATEKQIKIIRKIETTCEIECVAKTKQEVWHFIQKWLPKMQFIQTLDANLRIPVYSATKKYHGNDVHGVWEENYNNRNEINEEILKGHMLRGDAHPVDAFTEYLAYSQISLDESNE